MSGLLPDEDAEDVEEGERYARSPLTETWYRVTRWVPVDDEGRIRAVDKQEVDAEDVPAEARERIEGGSDR